MTNPVVEVYLNRDSGHYKKNCFGSWVLPDCPYCHKTHWHGAVPIDGGDELKPGTQGTRRPHCIEEENKCKDDYLLYWSGKVWPDDFIEESEKERRSK